jgi:hypothetical protein
VKRREREKSEKEFERDGLSGRGEWRKERTGGKGETKAAEKVAIGTMEKQTRRLIGREKRSEKHSG